MDSYLAYNCNAGNISEIIRGTFHLLQKQQPCFSLVT